MIGRPSAPCLTAPRLGVNEVFQTLHRGRLDLAGPRLRLFGGLFGLGEGVGDELTDGDAIAVDADWGKDGWIYFDSNQAGNFDIWRIRPTGELEINMPGARPVVVVPPGNNPPAPTTVHGR